MHKRLTAILIGACAAPALGAIPQMGGPMSHLLVSIFDQQVYLGFESPHMSTVELLEGGETFDGPASVLNHTGHNAQFGWLANGFVSIPSGSGVFVELVSSSPHLSVYEELTYDPILGTDGSSTVWQWSGAMTHNWYSADVKGPHSAVYDVYVGDTLGNRLEGWGAGRIELSFVFGEDLSVRIGSLGGPSVSVVPAPMSLSLLGLSGLAARRRR